MDAQLFSEVCQFVCRDLMVDFLLGVLRDEILVGLLQLSHAPGEGGVLAVQRNDTLILLVMARGQVNYHHQHDGVKQKPDACGTVLGNPLPERTALQQGFLEEWKQPFQDRQQKFYHVYPSPGVNSYEGPVIV